MIFCSLVVLLTNTNAQKKGSFDIFSFTAPKGFSTEKTADYAVVKKDNGVQYCNSFVMKARVSAGNAKADFDADWKSHAAKHGLTKPDKTTVAVQNGWTVTAGFGMSNFQNQQLHIAINTFTGKGISYCILHYFNDNNRFNSDMQTFNASVVPNGSKITALAANTNTGNNPVQPATIPAGGMQITKYITNFDDGWMSTITNDYVQVTKNGTEVRLYFVNRKLDGQRNENTGDLEPYYWNAIVTPAFNAGQIYVREKERYTMGVNDIWEAPVTNRQTGKSGYLGMRLGFSNGACSPIIVIAPDKNTYNSLFGKDDDFAKMSSYNKFAVAQKDLIGKWKSFEAASMDYYGIYTGDYGGTSTVSTNDNFIFNNNGSYQSEHTGTSIFRGVLSHGKSIYKGTFSVNDWNLKATNREANDPGEFFCQFEAVKGLNQNKLL
jgi:penicillin-binding protein-related factor A (putative recombinase)